MIKSYSLKNLQKEGIEDFFKFLDIIESKDIVYWLDYGTLLGAIREGKRIVWDDEFDISFWNEDLTKILSLLPKFENLGFRIEYLDGTHYHESMKYSNIKLKSNRSFVGIFTIDLHFYIRDSGYALRPYGSIPNNFFTQRIVSILRSNSHVKYYNIKSTNRIKSEIDYSFGNILKLLLTKYKIEDIFADFYSSHFYLIPGKYKNKNDFKILFKDFIINSRFCKKTDYNQHWSRLMRYYINILISRISPNFLRNFNFVLNLIYNNPRREIMKEVRINSEYFESQKEAFFEGRKVLVPSMFERYLIWNYGEDWKTPKIVWEFSIDNPNV